MTKVAIRGEPAFHAYTSPDLTSGGDGDVHYEPPSASRQSFVNQPLIDLQDRLGTMSPITSAQPQLPSPATPSQPFWSPLTSRPSQRETSSQLRRRPITGQSYPSTTLQSPQSDYSSTVLLISPPVSAEDLSDGVAVDTPSQSTPAASGQQKQGIDDGGLLDVVVEGIAQLTVAMHRDNSGRWRIRHGRRPHWIDEQYDGNDNGEEADDSQGDNETLSDSDGTDGDAGFGTVAP
jgi:hypothetical protein